MHSQNGQTIKTQICLCNHAFHWRRGLDIVAISDARGVKPEAALTYLSRSPCNSPPSQGIAEGEVQVAAVSTSEDFSSLLQVALAPSTQNQTDYSEEQLKHPSLKEVIEFLGS